ncbi:6-phospho-3-hexuloisomerase [Pullulanibacillus sp. KACC 23026]|uniref:6-phospho-3-hexuloisomerase n=1 Tax=Pullulanibacillus sp. KACC 23026 TaxID=3028315 RepID=UPI0023B06A80|nr:6-phospho-3-hexuloisomerase [Pullulanibacillus sp. KACC 23026]WEG10790.1 6-phospho-3-hexuloisomerase [Pullulanibacillus sp. KACC 23026]
MTKTKAILNEIENVINQVKETDLEIISQQLVKAPRIFVVGEGRSGLMAKSFAMRLMHLGATVYVVGETITPSMTKGDCLVAVSGSGTTQNVASVAQKSRALDCDVIVVTTNPESLAALSAASILHVPAATKFRKENEARSIQPLGSLFDQSVHLLFDTICLIYAELRDIDNQKAFEQHSNLE